MAKLRVDKIAASGQTSENTGAVYFDGTDDSLNIAANADFAYGTGDFTWEFWFKADAGFVGGSGGYLIDHAPASTDGNDGSVWVGSNTLYYHSAGVGGVSNLSFGGVSNETWYHVAVARESGTTRLFLNGSLANSASDAANFTTNNTRFRIGDYIGSGYAFKGYISNLRICKGHAVYKSQFIPPTRELEVHQGPDDNRTVLLACYDGENIFADKTGRHIISSFGDRTSSPTPTATDSPIGITTENPGLIRNVDPTDGPTFQGGAGYASQNWLTLPKGTTTDKNRTGGRGLFFGGYAPSPAALRNIIDYVTISSAGNAQDFGDLLSINNGEGGNCASSTRALAGGGQSNSVDITFVTISTTSNATDFGDLITGRRSLAGASSSTRGVFAGGTTPDMKNEIEYVTIATTGDTTDFGDLTLARSGPAGLSNKVRGVFGGGSSPTYQNLIDFVTIASTGNAADFGDLTAPRFFYGAASDSHGGIS